MVEKSRAPKSKDSIPQVNKLDRSSSVMGNFRSFTCLRYSRNAVPKASMYISPYQRTGRPGIISGFSHEGKGIDSGILHLESLMKGAGQLQLEEVVFLFQLVNFKLLGSDRFN